MPSQLQLLLYVVLCNRLLRENIYLLFDTVNHQILLTTLSSLGITGIPLHWFESYLNGRSFKVAWGGEVSTEHQLVTGVPQGSVLGLLLFSPYTTSLGPSYRHMVSHTIAILMTHSSISHFDQMIQRWLHGSQAAWRTSLRG